MKRPYRWREASTRSLLLLGEGVRHAVLVGPKIIGAWLNGIVIGRAVDGLGLALLRHGRRGITDRRLLAGDGLAEFLSDSTGSLGCGVHLEDELIDTGLVLPFAPCR